MIANPYIPVKAKIEWVKEETYNIRSFSFRPETPLHFDAGQFVELTIPGIGEAPFTPSSPPSISEHFELSIMEIGRVTETVHKMEAGAEVGVRGPLGTPYPLQDFKGREVLIVGGGCGLAPLRSLLYALFEEMDQYPRILFRYGARTPGDLLYRADLERKWGKNGSLDVLVTVDNGDETWSGNVGVVTTLLEADKTTPDVREGVAVVCGPPIMMKFTTLKLCSLGYPADRIYLSMEKNMSCGLGKCGHCRLGPYYACKEGPVFRYDRIMDLPKIWD